ncbi:phage shock protein C [Escherichia coli]|uniref:Phage shock protein C n=1 Tax=Escherichia coli TaxID=562 RepID=A0A376UBK7_ECOLX|nr:phage shock protein C [Escherichia coli]
MYRQNWCVSWWCCRFSSVWRCLPWFAYIILSFALDPMPDNMAFGEQLPSSSELLDEVDRELAASETRLREMERYVTSDTFTLRSRFRQL